MTLAIGLEFDPTDGMNKNEREYAEFLEGRRIIGEILSWEFEPMEFILVRGPKKKGGIRFTPDFLIVMADRTIEIHDTKGGGHKGPGGTREDADLKLKMAAKKFPWARWKTVHNQRNVGWVENPYN